MHLDTNTLVNIVITKPVEGRANINLASAEQNRKKQGTIWDGMLPSAPDEMAFYEDANRYRQDEKDLVGKCHVKKSVHPDWGRV